MILVIEYCSSDMYLSVSDVLHKMFRKHWSKNSLKKMLITRKRFLIQNYLPQMQIKNQKNLIVAFNNDYYDYYKKLHSFQTTALLFQPTKFYTLPLSSMYMYLSNDISMKCFIFYFFMDMDSLIKQRQ